jgi:mannose/cellobiose epimerase-like protein (N-acyl-D-glucosamine 2-epimerase family)
MTKLPNATRGIKPAPGAVHTNAMVPSVDDFRDRAFLLEHVADTLAFYAPAAQDPSGGFFHYFKDDGSVYNRTSRHLVSSCRFVFNYAMAYRHFRDPQYLEYARHALAFLRDAHWDATHRGYDWEIEWRNGEKRTVDGTRHCYGLAFVLLAQAHAAMAGIEQAKLQIAETFELMERRFWDPAAGLYADEATPDWHVSSYRGQNANMHTTEALLAAYEATGHLVYLDRAERVASNVTERQAKLSHGLVWEHFHADWSVDWHYNEEDSSNIFRPWGFQPGHQTEWAKLLLILERHRPLPWLLPRAVELFDAALTHAWDDEHGGLCYGFGPDGKICDHDKYFWVQAETLAAAALLGHRTGSERFWDWYDEIWSYSWTHFVDHRHGAWYRILTCDNRKYSDEKSPAGKTDYHTMGACYEVLNALGETNAHAGAAPAQGYEASPNGQAHGLVGTSEPGQTQPAARGNGHAIGNGKSNGLAGRA